MANGKFLREDLGISYGRTRDWPAIPKDIVRRVPASGSTTVRCSECGGVWDGLIYEPETETFRHRQESDCRLQRSRR